MICSSLKIVLKNAAVNSNYLPAMNIIAGDTPIESANPWIKRPRNNISTESVDPPNNGAKLTRIQPKKLMVWNVMIEDLRPKISLMGPPIRHPIICPTTKILAEKYKLFLILNFTIVPCT